jgi:hypothetical protein
MERCFILFVVLYLLKIMGSQIAPMRTPLTMGSALDFVRPSIGISDHTKAITPWALERHLLFIWATFENIDTGIVIGHRYWSEFDTYGRRSDHLFHTLYVVFNSIESSDKNGAYFYKNPKIPATREIPTQDGPPLLAGELNVVRLLDSRLLVLPETVLLVSVLLAGFSTTRRYLLSLELFPLFPFDRSTSQMYTSSCFDSSVFWLPSK